MATNGQTLEDWLLIAKQAEGEGMAEDEVARRAAEINRQRQQAAEAEEARKLEIDWQIERARERLEEARKLFAAFWSNSTTSEVVWGSVTSMDDDDDDDDSSPGGRGVIPAVSVSMEISFWRRQLHGPELVEIGVMSVSNIPLVAGQTETGDYSSDDGPAFREHVPPRAFTYEFETCRRWPEVVGEAKMGEASTCTSLAQFVETVGKIAITAIASSISDGSDVIAPAAANAEIRKTRLAEQGREMLVGGLGLVLWWALIGAVLLFFVFVIALPLSDWFQEFRASLGIGR